MGQLTISSLMAIALQASVSTSALAESPIHNHVTGSDFMVSTATLGQEQREQAIFEQVRKQGVAPSSAKFYPVNLKAKAKDGQVHSAIIWVSADYMTLGTENDDIRIPMNPITATRLGRELGFGLPTRKLVDAIYRAAEVKLAPRPMKPSQAMVTNAYYERHETKVDRQMNDVIGSQGIIAGHKKDIVLTNRLVKRPRQVAIYGWHRTNGKAIQPVSLIHGDYYADYSHGVRMVHNKVLVDGAWMNYSELLKHPVLHALVSDEGPVDSATMYRGSSPQGSVALN